MNNRTFSVIAKCTLLVATISITPATYAGYYVAAKAGMIQGSFNQNYTDIVDVIAANISTNVQQYGYTGGVAVGYQQLVKQIYLLGGELAGNLDSHHATFQSGAP